MKKIIFFIAVFIANNNNDYCQSSDLSFSDATYTIIVDYSKTIKELIADCNFGAFDSCINDTNFPLTAVSTDSVKELSAKLINFDREWISSDDAIAKMNQAGYRPATIFELAAFAEKYRKEQKKFIILALGSTCNAYIALCVAGLYFYEGTYQLNLFDGKQPGPFWPTSVFRFLIIHK